MDDKLILKPIKDLLGEHFYIPHYQRGYRWTSQQVKDLLNDIWVFINDKKNKNEAFYCLQPIVVKKKSWDDNGHTINGWEVIDGQQRLTTIYIILDSLTKLLKIESLKEEYGNDIFSLMYETRPLSAEFLKNIREDKNNIDFYYIGEANKTISEWFADRQYTKDRSDRNKFADTLLGKKEDNLSVQVIWYHVEDVDSIELFNRLNIGKIPLTNAELIKALFLSSSSFEKESPQEAVARRIEISQIWDEIEQKLNEEDEHFWSFITNAKRINYSTKIDLIFDLKAKKNKDTKDPLFTFLHFLKDSKVTTLWEIWLSIEQYYLTLCQWYRDKNLYHKIGYLIAVGENISDLIELSMKIKKSDFEERLNDKIRTSIRYKLEDLSYDNDAGYDAIEKILLLFNVESIRTNEHISEYFPFKVHKNTQWSLEHIHALKSESLDKTKKEVWLKWLEYHESLILELYENERDGESKKEWKNILTEIEECDSAKITWEKFSFLSNKIIDRFSEKKEGHTSSPHSISNLALLGQPENSALNNAVYEVKRRELIKMDRQGSYIPLCTRRTFLKYYSDRQSSQQYLFWGADDRKNYLQEIRTVLGNYLLTEKEMN